MPRSSTPSRGVAQMTTPNQRARMSQASVATSTPESSSRHSSQNASGAAIPASTATLGRIAASLRAAIAFSAEVSVSTIQSHADVVSAPSTSSRQRPWSCRGKRSAPATRAHGRAEARRYVTSRGAIRDKAREPGPGYSVVCDLPAKVTRCSRGRSPRSISPHHAARRLTSNGRSDAHGPGPDPATCPVRRPQRRVHRRPHRPPRRRRPAQAILTGAGAGSTVMAIFFTAVSALP